MLPWLAPPCARAMKVDASDIVCPPELRAPGDGWRAAAAQSGAAQALALQVRAARPAGRPPSAPPSAPHARWRCVRLRVFACVPLFCGGHTHTARSQKKPDRHPPGSSLSSL